MGKSTTIGIIILLGVIVVGLFVTGIIQVKSPTGKVIDNPPTENIDKGTYPTGQVVNSANSGKNREEQFIDDYYLAVDLYFEGILSCWNKCPEDIFGYISSECFKGCENIYDGEYILATNLLEKYSKNEIEISGETNVIEKDRRYYQLMSKENCFSSCAQTKQCINKCLQ